MKKKRYSKKAKRAQNILYTLCIALIVLVVGIIVFISLQMAGADNEPQTSSEASVESVVSEETVVSSAVSEVSSLAEGAEQLDPDYERLLLVNGKNPLPKDYNYTANIIKIDNKYLCGYRNQIDKYAYPYATAMMEQAWKDNVELFILSPYRSYDSQVILFNNQVDRELKKGVSSEQAKLNASTVVAAPGTSEHHTGLAIDFNSVEDSFENTEQFKWLKENAADFGFVLRYPKGKEDITGVIYEPWHWRFIGIKHAKKMNELDMCFEEYTEYLEKSSNSTGSKAE